MGLFIALDWDAYYNLLQTGETLSSSSNALHSPYHHRIRGDVQSITWLPFQSIQHTVLLLLFFFCRAQQDFRLHQSDLVLNNNSSQFSDVSRINRMFRVVQQPQIPKAATISDKSDKSEEPVTVQRIITGRSIAMEPLSEWWVKWWLL